VSRGRLEVFSDGVIAILITIMVLELKVPHGGDWQALRPLWPSFSTYVLSYVYLGIYWNNHHHMMHTVERVNGAILWANLHLLFWLSLVPVVTGWMGENHFAPLPTAVYGLVLVMASIAYAILEWAIIRNHGLGSKLGAALGGRRKELLSTLLYVAAIPLAFVARGISVAIYATVALTWLIPDRRIEAKVNE
jgi:uncharacterized membrane protein